MINICYESSKQCNLHCEYCITSDNPTPCQKTNYTDIISSISKLNPQRIVVSGGEPLLDPSLKQKLKLIRDKNPSSYISLSTNGTISYEYSSLTNLVDCIDVSLPSLDEAIYTSMRGEKLLSSVLANIELITASKIDTRISFMLTKVNYSQVSNVINYAKNVGASSIRIGRFLPFRDSIKHREKYELSDNEIEQVIQGLETSPDDRFKIIPPIKSLQFMEDGYVTVDYTGTYFLPTQNGKKIICNVDDILSTDFSSLADSQKAIFKILDIKENVTPYNKVFHIDRIRKSDTKRIPIDEFYSDRTKIIYSSAFRRLQQKAQVFSLETNSAVHSRLSHSIEVSDIGRRLAIRIANRLSESAGEYQLPQGDIQPFVAIVENGCLMHDIGNPPFGHFGEEAIKKWWNTKHEDYIKVHNKRAASRKEKRLDFSPAHCEALLSDFVEFDGNPQGLRTVMRLQNNDKDSNNAEYQSGLNLTFSTLMCALKYSR